MIGSGMLTNIAPNFASMPTTSRHTDDTWATRLLMT